MTLRQGIPVSPGRRPRSLSSLNCDRYNNSRGLPSVVSATSTVVTWTDGVGEALFSLLTSSPTHSMYRGGSPDAGLLRLSRCSKHASSALSRVCDGGGEETTSA